MTNRQWEVLRILLRDKKTTISKIANELEVHTRTIERNIERLISTGVAVTKKQGRGGGVYIHEKYKVDIELLTDRDILELFSAASVYANIFETDFLKRMNRKITLLNPESMQIVRTIIDRCLVIDLFEKPIKIDEQIELEIRKAIMLEHNIIIKLQGEIKQVTVFPISYVIKSDGCYLYVFDLEYMLIPCHKIIEVKVCREKTNRIRHEWIEYKKNENIKKI